MEEEQNNLEYQETMMVDVENIPKNKKNIQRPIYELIHAPFFDKTNILPPEFLDKCKNNPNEPQFLPS